MGEYSDHGNGICVCMRGWGGSASVCVKVDIRHLPQWLSTLFLRPGDWKQMSDKCLYLLILLASFHLTFYIVSHQTVACCFSYISWQASPEILLYFLSVMRWQGCGKAPLYAGDPKSGPYACAVGALSVESKCGIHICYTCLKKESDTWYSMDAPWWYYVKWNKTVKKTGN